MTKHQACPRCHKDFVGPDSHIGENICGGCLLDEKEVILEAECPACGEIVQFYEIGIMICPHCKGAKTELTTTDWEIIEEKEDE